MEVPDHRALALAGGPNTRISIIPAAAAPENDHHRAGQNGISWFQTLGATNVTALPLIDRASADDPTVVETLRRSRLIYLLGGSPHYLGRVLIGSLSWQAILTAHQAGAVIAGSSAGAMVLCEHYYDPAAREALKGLGLVPGACVLPHHDTFGQVWASRLAKLLPGAVLVGIDEETGMLNDGPWGQWQVYGKGMVTLYRGNQTICYKSGKVFALHQ
jgi:cyanophycinase